MHRITTVLIVGVILGVGIALGFGGRTVLDWRGSGPEAATISSGPPGDPTAVIPAQAAALSPAAAQAPTRPAPTATAVSRDVVMEVTETQLETQLTEMLVGQSLGSTPLGEATVQTVNVQLRDSLIQIGGTARAGFLQAPFLAAGTVVPNSEGRPVVRVSQASVAGIELPESARTALAESLQTHVDDLLGDGSVHIRTIDIADGKMRVVGRSGS